MKKQLPSILTMILLSFAAFGKNKAFESGNNGYLSCANSPFTGNSNFTFELWFNGNHTGETYARLLSFKDNVFEISAGKGALKIYDGAWRTTTATGLNIGWHHVAVTKDAVNTIVYVDGVSIYTKASSTLNFLNNSNFRILGTVSGNSTEKVIGKVDEVKIWNRALSLLEISVSKNGQISPVQTGLIAYYDFNDGLTKNKVSGGTSYDLSLVGTGTIVETNYEDYVKDFAMNYDGSDDKTYMATTPISGNADFTVEMQFKTSASDANVRRLMAATNYGCEVALVNGTIKSYINSGSWITIGTASGFNDDLWHHFALTKSGTTLTFYIDGNLIGTRTATLNINTYLYFGGSQTIQSTDMFKGTLDEIRVWSTVKTQPEIESSMNEEVEVNASGLLAYFDFNTPTGATLVPSLVSAGTGLTRSGSSGTNNNPQFVAATKNAISTSISEIFSAEKEMLSVYPNPVNDVLNINTNGTSQIIVLDAAGKEIMNLNTTSSQIDLSALNQGIYFLQVLNNEEIKTAKIIKN